MIAATALLVSCSAPEVPTARQSISTALRLAPGTAKPFAKGEGFETVRAAMGEPDASQDRDGGVTIWNYQFSTVIFRRGKVFGWNNVSDNLRTSGAGESGENMVRANRGEGAGESQTIAVPGGIIGRTSFAGAPPAYGATSSSIQTVESYRRADGTVVPRHVRTTSDGSRSNNFSTQGNVNPYTSRRGYR